MTELETELLHSFIELSGEFSKLMKSSRDNASELASMFASNLNDELSKFESRLLDLEAAANFAEHRQIKFFGELLVRLDTLSDQLISLKSV